MVRRIALGRRPDGRWAGSCWSGPPARARPPRGAAGIRPRAGGGHRARVAPAAAHAAHDRAQRDHPAARLQRPRSTTCCAPSPMAWPAWSRFDALAVALLDPERGEFEVSTCWRRSAPRVAPRDVRMALDRTLLAQLVASAEPDPDRRRQRRRGAGGQPPPPRRASGYSSALLVPLVNRDGVFGARHPGRAAARGVRRHGRGDRPPSWPARWPRRSSSAVCSTRAGVGPRSWRRSSPRASSSPLAWTSRPCWIGSAAR